MTDQTGYGPGGMVLRMPATMLCSLCMHIYDDDRVSDAVTVINGHAVCIDHVGYVQSGNWSLALATAKRDAGISNR